ncbi:MAG: Rieske 2Fe-2S domain-containing protein [archaeon]
MAEITVLKDKAQLKLGSAMVVEAEGKKYALYNVDGKFYATINECPHRQGPLGEGVVDGENVICPWHGWQFNVKTGVSPVNPAAKIETKKVRVEGDAIVMEV